MGQERHEIYRRPEYSLVLTFSINKKSGEFIFPDDVEEDEIRERTDFKMTGEEYGGSSDTLRKLRKAIELYKNT